MSQVDTAKENRIEWKRSKRLSHINDRARAADHDPAFSNRIRDGLPGMAIPSIGLRPNTGQQPLTAKRD
jgi:hypothetical protein